MPVRREASDGPDGAAGDEGIAPVIDEEEDAPDGRRHLNLSVFTVVKTYLPSKNID